LHIGLLRKSYLHNIVVFVFSKHPKVSRETEKKIFIPFSIIIYVYSIYKK